MASCNSHSVEQLPLSSQTVSSLRKIRVYSVHDFLLADSAWLNANAGVTTEEYRAVLLFVQKFHAPRVQNGVEVWLQRQAAERSGDAVLPTLTPWLDDLLGGGLRCGQILELAGEPYTGKSLICVRAVAAASAHGHQSLYLFSNNNLSGARLCESVSRALGLLDELSRAEAEAVDGEGSCCSQEKTEIIPNTDMAKSGAEEGMLDSGAASILPHLPDVIHMALCRIHTSSISRAIDVLTALRDLYKMLRSDNASVRNLRLVAIDSFGIVCATVLGTFQHGRAMMMECASFMKAIAQRYNISFLITNYLVNDGHTGKKPALGVSWKSVPHVRLMLQRDSKSAGRAVATVLSSNRSPCKQFVKYDVG